MVSESKVKSFSNKYLGWQLNTFYENKNIYPDSVLYFAKLSNGFIWVTNHSLITDNFSIINDTINGNVVVYNFVNSKKSSFEVKSNNSSVSVIKSNLKSEIQTFSEITLLNLYNNIDLRLYFDKQFLRYDFKINENGKYKDIQMQVLGVDKIDNIDNQLTINSQYGSIIHKNLKVFTKEDGIELQSAFFLKNNIVSFEVNSEFKTPLIIDPLVYSTYLGGDNFDYAQSITHSKNFDLYITGFTSSTNFPVTVGAYRESIRLNKTRDPDVFICKFDTLGNLIHSTYFGSFSEDKPSGIVVDSLGDVIISGSVRETQTFPTSDSSFQKKHNGGFDTFIAKFDSTLSKLKYCTLLGGRNDDFSQSITVDTANNIIICGYSSIVTDSIFFPVTNNAYQKNSKGKNDIFITKITSKLDSLIYSTLIGGSEDDFPQDLILIDQNKLFIVGSTRSTDFPRTQNALDISYNDSSDSSLSDIFILVFNIEYLDIDYGSYFGGSKKDVAYSVVKDTLMNFYFTGFTESPDFPVSLNPYDKTYNSEVNSKGRGDIFVTKFNYDIKKIEYSTFIGGNESERAYELILDSIGNVYLTGFTFSKTFPTSKGAYSRNLIDTAQSDAFFLKLSNMGDKILYSTLLGGNDADYGKALLSLDNNSFFVIGSTSSQNFPTSPDAMKKNYNDSAKSDMFISKIILEPNDFKTDDNYYICNSAIVKLSSILINSSNSFGFLPYTYKWSPSIGLDFDDVPYPNASVSFSTTYSLTVTDSKGNQFFDSIAVNVINNSKPIVYGNILVLQGLTEIYRTENILGVKLTWICNGGDIVSGQGSTDVTVSWKNTISGAIYVSYENSYGCRDTSEALNVLILGNNEPKVYIALGKLIKCTSDTLILDSGPGFSDIVWSNGILGRYDTIFVSGKYWYKANNQISKQVVSDSVTVLSSPSPSKPIIKYTDGELRCLATNVTYQWFYNDLEISGAINRKLNKIGNGNYRCKVFSANKCGTYSDYLIINDSVVSGIENNIEINTWIFPNPNNGVFDITNIGLYNHFKITDVLGRLVYEMNIEDSFKIYNVDISKFSKGLYYIVFSSTNKFSKQLIYVQ